MMSMKMCSKSYREKKNDTEIVWNEKKRKETLKTVKE